MPRGYKVRLEDGSEIGPLDQEMLRSWYQQGLIEDDSPVLGPGAQRWTRLSQVVDVRSFGVPPRLVARKRKAAPAPLPDDFDQPVVGVPPVLRSYAAAALLLLGAAVAGFWALFPESSLPDLDAAPWREIALAQLVLGISLVRGWELARRLVRIVVLLLAFALFPVAGVLFAQGMRGRVLLVLLCAWVAASGLFGLLSGAMLSRWQSLLGLAAALAGFAAAGYFAYVAPGEGHRQVQRRASSQRRFLDQDLGLRAELPDGWYVLEKGQSLPSAPPEAELWLIHPRLGATGFLAAERSLRGGLSADQYLRGWLERRRKLVPSLTERDRSDVRVGKLAGRSLAASWTSAEGAYREVTAVWRDGWNYFALAAWAPEAKSERLEDEFQSLLASFSPDGHQTERLEQLTRAISDAVPQLSPRASELLLMQATEPTLEPAEACRRAWQARARAEASLDPLEVRELAYLDSVLLASLEAKERARLSAYLGRLRAQQPTTPDEDREMSRLMAVAVGHLPETTRSRLQALYEKALALALRAS